MYAIFSSQPKEKNEGNNVGEKQVFISFSCLKSPPPPTPHFFHGPFDQNHIPLEEWIMGYVIKLSPKKYSSTINVYRKHFFATLPFPACKNPFCIKNLEEDKNT